MSYDKASYIETLSAGVAYIESTNSFTIGLDNIIQTSAYLHWHDYEDVNCCILHLLHFSLHL